MLPGLIFLPFKSDKTPTLVLLKNYVLAKSVYNSKKMSFKEVAKWVIPTSFVSKVKTMLTYIFGNNCDAWTHPSSSFIILLLSISLVFSISLAFAVTKDPTPIFIFPRFA